MLCGACGFLNAADLKFCGECGARLDASVKGSGRERKVVSVLFCDLVGFTAASDGADPEDVQAALSPYHARARSEIERFGGTVEKFIGDAVMAAFGAPVVHEDDPERAVRAGLALLAAVEDLNRIHGLGLAVRVGVATGEAVVSTGAHPERGEGMLAGDVVNTAARLQTSAPVGSVVVGEATWRATRGVIEYRSLDPVSVKGKTLPLSVWAAVGPRARVGEALADTATVLVGRRDELEMLQRTYARCVREASVQLVTIVAEPGVGKSRLVQEFSDWVDRREELVTWRQGRCLAYGDGITYWPLGQIVKADAGILETDPLEVVSAKLEAAVTAVVQDASQVGWMVARVGPLVGLVDAGGGSREELFTAVQRLLESIAASGPLVVVLEDLHWAEPALLDFCEHVLQWMAGVPVMLVATARPELFDKAPTWGAGHRNATMIGLSALDDAETAQLVTAMLGTAVLTAATHALLLRRAAGNPLYAGEFIRMLADRGRLPDPGHVDLPDGDVDLAEEFPESVQAIIAARLDTLRAESKGLLLDAAVIGQTFWSGAVAALAGIDESSVRTVLHELSRREFLRPARVSTVAGQVEYMFGHALVAEVAYQQIPRASRATKHQNAARWLERLIDTTTEEEATQYGGEQYGGEQVAIIAYHYTRAHALTVASGTGLDTLTELSDQVRRWQTLAGDQAIGLDVAAAECHYQTALDVTPTDHPQYPEALMKLAETYFSLGKYQDAESTYLRAQREHKSHGNIPQAALAAVRVSDTMKTLGRVADADLLLDESIILLEEHKAGPELAEAFYLRAVVWMIRGRFREAISWATKAIELAEQLDPPPVRELAGAQGNRGNARLRLGDSAGEQDMRHGLDLALQHNLTGVAASILANLGVVKLIAESPTAALVEYKRALDLLVSTGRRAGVVRLIGNIAEDLVLSGQWEEALHLCDKTVGPGPDADDDPDATFMHVVRAGILAARGDYSPVEIVIDRLLASARGSGETAILIPALIAAVRCADGRDDHACIVGLAAELDRVLDPVADTDHCQFLPDIARILVPVGRAGVVERLAAAAPRGLVQHDDSVLTARAVLAEADGDVESAATRYQDAADGWRRYGNPFEQAQALLGAGRCLQKLHRNAEPELAEALDIFKSLGAQPCVAEVTRLRRPASPHPPASVGDATD